MPKKRKIITPGTYDFAKIPKITIPGESQTIPGDSYTIRELLKKHTQGIMPPIGRQTYYDDADIDSPDPTKAPDFDLTDVTDIKNQIQTDIEKRENESKLKAQKKQQENAEKAKEKLRLEIQNEEKEKSVT
nr:MAG: hypothetical protein [Microvirus sp.]